MKNFKFILILRIIFISVSIAAGFYFFFPEKNYLLPVIFLILAVIQILYLIKYLDNTNRYLTRFLNSIQYSDFSQTFSDQKMGKSFKELNESFNSVMDKFRKARSEKEEQYRYLQTVLRHIGIGLISFDSNGNVEFINHSAKKILGVHNIKDINILNKLNKDFSKKLFDLKPGDKTTIKIYDENDVIQLMIYATEFKMRDSLYKLVSIQNIQSELEEKEIEAWQKLIRVLTHEIMNSVTPISSLASTVNVMLGNSGESKKVSDEDIDDIKSAVSTIQRRSEGLIKFVENYRSLTKIPKPNFEIVPVKQLFERINKLLRKELEEKNINLQIEIEPESIEITADPSLIEQIIINLLINAIQALSNQTDKKIILGAFLTARGKIIIKVADNGIGIPEDMQEKIFIPFFSTKQEGSGIGLSLARQIMRQHGGNIRVSSIPGKETVFTLVF